MNMSDIRQEDVPKKPKSEQCSDDNLEAERARWHALVSDMGAEIAAPLTAAMERINALTSTGRIDRNGLRSLRAEVETARQVGMIGQQLIRFASGRLRQSHERLQLAQVLEGVIAHRSRETVAAALEDFDAPPVQVPLVESPALLESSLAPPVALSHAEDEASAAPPVQLPADMLAALAEAA